MECKNCGAATPAGMSNCQRCGAQIAAEVAQGAVAPHGAKQEAASPAPSIQPGRAIKPDLTNPGAVVEPDGSVKAFLLVWASLMFLCSLGLLAFLALVTASEPASPELFWAVMILAGIILAGCYAARTGGELVRRVNKATKVVVAISVVFGLLATIFA